MNLLVIEDEPEFADFLKRGLIYEGYQVQIAGTAENGLEAVVYHQPELIILDVMLPDIDGMVVCRDLRERDYSGPILMLTARDTVDDRVAGLAAGADDYLVKPFEFDELLARLRALMRRKSIPNSIISFADLNLDQGLRCAFRPNRHISLSRTEYDLLTYFLTHPQRVLTRDVLIENVWGFDNESSANVLDVYISRLRQKLGEPTLIQTLHGVGYILKE